MKVNNKLSLNFGYLKINPTFNNICITLTDYNGNVLISRNAGMLNFKGRKKKTPFVGSVVMEDLIIEMRKKNIDIKLLILQINGFIRTGRVKTIIKQLSSMNVNNIFYVEYINKQSHNGMRLKKKRRL